jgi:cell division protein FtsA
MNEISRRMLPPTPARPEPVVAKAPPQKVHVAPPPPEPPAARGRSFRAGPFGVLDIGTTKIVCLIGRPESDGTIRILGYGWQRGRGVRGGGISDLEEAEKAIRTTVGQAEEMADLRLRAVTVNLTCGQPESRLINVQWQVGGRAISEQDVRRVMLEARSRGWSEGRETIHTLPLAFDVDEMTGVEDPRGLHCEMLAARMHVIDASSTALRNLSTCIARCDLDIAELVSAPMAAGLATLVEDERQLGATVIDMGGGTSGMAVFAEGQVRHTAQLPVGGAHVTNDIARLLSTTVAHAERLKTLYGNCEGSPDDEREMLPVPLVGEEEHQISRIPRSSVVSIIRPRLEETFELVRERLDGSGQGRAAGTRVVLTGGACQLPGAREMAARILGRQVRLGRPMNLRGLPDASSGPAFATAAGLLAWAAGQGRPLVDIDAVSERPPGWLGRLVHFLRERM